MIAKQLQHAKFILLNGKIPIEKNWQTEANYPYDHNKIITHEGNLGLATGYANILGIDSDDETITNLLENKLPKTLTIKTGSEEEYKKHFIFECEDGKNGVLFNEDSKVIGHIQFKGKQLVAPGSIHPDTKKEYKIIKDLSITKIKFEDIQKILWKYLITKKEKQTTNFKKDEDIEEIKQKVSVVGLMNEYGFDTSRNPTECIWHSSKGKQNFSYNDELWHCFHCEKSGDVFSLIMEQEKCDFVTAKQKLMEKTGIGKKEELYIWDEKHDKDTGVLISKKLIITNISTNILNTYKIITVGEEKLDMYCYDNDSGLYKKNGERIINEYTQKKTEGVITIHQLNEIKGQLQRQTYKERDVLVNGNLNLICVGNGVLNLETLELLPFTSKEIFTQKIGWDYKSESGCSKIKKFLGEVLDDEDVNVLQEFAGYCLYRKYFIKKALIFWGGKNTGKTTVINLMVKFIGQMNTSGVSLHKIIYDKFAGYRLYGKFLNFFDDLSFKDIKDTGSFKITTGGGYISAEKKFGDSFEFMNHAKLLFATNKFSAVVDTDDMAYYDRWIIIPFDTNFDENNEFTDKRILDKITTPEEMSGMLCWALEGLKRVMDNERFSYNKTADENRITMEKNSNSIVSFIHDEISQEDNNFIATSDLYDMYCHYINDNGLPKETLDKFSKTLPKKIPYAVACRRDCEKDKKTEKNVRGYLNVKISTKYTVYTTYFNIYMKQKGIRNDNVFIQYNVKKRGIDGIEKPPDQSTIKDTLISIFAMQSEIEIQQFLTRFPEDQHKAIDVILDNLKRDGDIYEHRNGFIKLL